jgi:hypothetical protein
MENKDEEIEKKTTDIDSRIKSLKEELDSIQGNCPHSDYEIKFNDEKAVKRFCKSCKKEMNYASDKEREDFLKGKKN